MQAAPPRVILRMRPSNTEKAQLEQNGNIVIISGPKPDKSKATGGPQYQFQFDSVCWGKGQEEVYQVAAADVLQSALNGFNGTVMCYGQTGAGKTFTMSGGRKQSFSQRGLIPRAITHLFSELRATPGQESKVSISYLEIYNDNVFDLLDITTAPHEINLYEDRSSRVNIVGLRTVTVTSEKEALALLFEGEANRVISEHQLNRESSRSHAIFTINLETRSANDSSGMVVSSKLNLVDLAGSERVSKTKSEGTVLKEAAHINKSLSILEQVVIALGEGADHVPFRSSKLTHVLKDAVGGNCKTVLVANVWGEANQLNETLSTCRFATRLQRLKCVVTPNVVEDSATKIKALQSQVKSLQLQLGGQGDASVLADGSSSMWLSEQERASIRQQAAQFLATPHTSRSLEPLDLSSTAAIHETLLCVRELHQLFSKGSSTPLTAAPHPRAPQPSACANQQGSVTNRSGQQPQSNGGKPGHALPPLQLQQQQQHQHLHQPHSLQQQQQQQQQQRHQAPPPPPASSAGFVGDLEEGPGFAQAGGVGVAPELGLGPPPPPPPPPGPSKTQQQAARSSTSSTSSSLTASQGGPLSTPARAFSGAVPTPAGLHATAAALNRSNVDRGSKPGSVQGRGCGRQAQHTGASEAGGDSSSDGERDSLGSGSLQSWQLSMQGVSGGGFAEERRQSGLAASSSSSVQQHAPMSREAAFEAYKTGPGAEKASLLSENKTRLRELKGRAKKLGLSINAAKYELDELKPKADSMKAARQAKGPEQSQVLSTEEYDTLMRIKDLKTQYKDQFAELQMARSEADYTQQLCDTCTQEFVDDFKMWYTTEHAGADLEDAHNKNPEYSGGGSAASYTAQNPVQGMGSGGLRSGIAPKPRAPGVPSLSCPVAPKGPGPALKAQQRPPAQKLRAPDLSEVNEPGAAAFYAAQNASAAQGTNAHRPGSLKKRVGAHPPF